MASSLAVPVTDIVTGYRLDFLLDEPELFAAIRGFIASAARARGLEPA
jgi:homoserine O-acetyltransferase